MPRYRIAHLGCGGRGTEHIRALCAAQDRLDLVGLCDLDSVRLEKMAAECPSSVARYTDAAKMLRELKPDIFSFITQPHLRFPLIQLGADAGVRAISFEKPMALSLTEAREICRVAKEANVLLTVSHQHKYGQHWRSVKALIDQGELGEIRTIHATSMGSTAHYATHLIDYSMWLVNYPKPLWAIANAHDWDRVDPRHPSPGYLMGPFALDTGTRIIIECGQDSPDQPGYNIPPIASLDYWYDAGVTVTGTEGTANVIVGKGWSAVTAKSGRLGSTAASFDGVADTVPYYRELAQALDDPAYAHVCRGEIALRGYEVLAAFYRSVCLRQKITLPLSQESPLEEMKALLVS